MVRTPSHASPPSARSIWLRTWYAFCTLGSFDAANCAVGQFEGAVALCGVWANADAAAKTPKKRTAALRICNILPPYADGFPLVAGCRLLRCQRGLRLSQL